jgi:hypothetical protein
MRQLWLYLRRSPALTARLGNRLGFDYFYGFLAGESSQYEPAVVENTVRLSVDKLPPGSQLFGFCLFRTFEIIVRLHEKKPGTVAIADRTCLLKIFFRSIPQ